MNMNMDRYIFGWQRI